MEEKAFKTSFLGQELNVLYVTTPKTTKEIIAKLLKKDCLFGLDTETMPLPMYASRPGAGLDPYLSRVRLLQITDGNSIVVFDLLKILSEGMASYLFQCFLTTKKFVAHNALFDLQFLMREFCLRKMDINCTYLLWKIITHAQTADDEGLRASLDILVEKLLGVPMLKTLQVSDWSSIDLTWEQIEYSSLDAIAVLRLAEKIVPTVEGLGCMRYYKLLKAAQIPIANMQLNGIGINRQRHMALVEAWRDSLWDAKKELVKVTSLDKITNHTIAEFLENNLPAELVAVWPRTEEGKLMCDAHTLLDYSDAHPLINIFAIYQKKEKLTTSFGMNLLHQINPETDRLHAQYKLCGARTGRLSCNKPNLQQLPRDKEVRANFIPDKNRVFLCADYSQIELRVGAELSRDKRMLEAYRNGMDLHTLTASIVGKKAIKNVTKEDRQKAKAFNFGLMFGLGPRKFSRYAKHSYGVDISNEEAKQSIKLWRDTYAGYHTWQKRQAEKGAEHLRVRTACGKLRMLDPDNVYGASMNTPVQGSASECMLAALVGLQYDIDNEMFSKDVKLCNCVHDEIIVECAPEDAPKVKELIEKNMAEGFLYVFPNGIVKNICEVGEGSSWGSAKS